jgi:hypothetical protein
MMSEKEISTTAVQAEGPTDEAIHDFNNGVKNTTTGTMPRNPFSRVPLNRNARRARGYRGPGMSKAQAEARRAAIPRIDIADVRKRAREIEEAKKQEKMKHE